MGMRRWRQDDGEAGVAMIMVIIVTVILLLVPVALASAAVGQLPLARHDQDFSSALAAAESGVDDYINRLNANPNYWQTSVANTTANTPPSPSDHNHALTGWVPVSNLNPASLVEGYCYTVDMTGTTGSYVADSSVSSIQGIVILRAYGYAAAGGSLPAASTGANPCVGPVPRGGVERMVQVDLRQQGFLDDLELTDLQLVDQSWFNQQQGQNVTGCYNNVGAGHLSYYWANLPQASTSGWGCFWLENYWGTGNVLNGPVRSNDDFYICGTPVFNALIESDDPNATVGVNGGKYWADPYNGCGTDAPDFDSPNYQQGSPSTYGTITGNPSLIQFPSTDSSQINYAKAVGGCYFVGPTDVVLNGSTMTVVSPLTTSADSPNAAACVGNNVPLPTDGVLYVDGAAANCSAAFGQNLNWAYASPLPSSDVCTSGSAPGDLFVSGTAATPLTMVAADNAFLTGDLLVSSTAPSSQVVLGLIANNYIEVVHAVSGSTQVFGHEPFYGSTTIPSPANFGTSKCSRSNSGSSGWDCLVTVDAAMLSLSHSVGIQDYADNNNPPGSGSQGFGTLKIYGALAQEYMDIEGIFSGNCSYTTQGVPTQLCTGMNSVYTYDPRLAHLSPPHFLDPVYSEWKKLSFEECMLSGCQS